MRQLLIEVIMYNFHLFEHTPDSEFSTISDVVESFYTFNAQITKKLPQAFADDSVDCVKLIHFGKEKFLRFWLSVSQIDLLDYFPIWNFQRWKQSHCPKSVPSSMPYRFSCISSFNPETTSTWHRLYWRKARRLSTRFYCASVFIHYATTLIYSRIFSWHSTKNIQPNW